MRRRSVLAGLVGTGICPKSLLAQGPRKSVGILVGQGSEAQGKWRVDAFRRGLMKYGWTDGQNIRVEYRWPEGDPVAAKRHAEPLVGATHEKARIVEDGNVITAGGVTSGIDFGLAVVAEIAGDAVAQDIQLSIEYDPNPPFDSGHPDRASETVKAAVAPRYEQRRAAFRDRLVRRPKLTIPPTLLTRADEVIE